MKAFRISLLLFVGLIPLATAGQTDTVQHVTPGRANSVEQQKKQYVIVISADGFRYDYTSLYHAENLLRLGARGSSAASMIPSYPSLTFPNHYTIATGMYPVHHGLVDNMFYDPKKNSVYSMSDKKKVSDKQWYGGVPLWVLAERQKMLSASFYWVASEAPVLDTPPTYFYTYNELIPMQRRLNAVRNWLLLPPDKRPHLIMFYLPQPDHAGHMFGPESPETATAVRQVDDAVGQLATLADSLRLPVNYVFVSDHGMTKSDTTDMIKVPAVLTDTSKCRWTGGATMLMVYPKNKLAGRELYESLKTTASGYDVYRSENTPGSWHFNKKEDTYGRLGNIILAARYPRLFRTSKAKPYPGRHGYDPSVVKEMQATFIAWGPQIKQTEIIPSFENINVYPLVTRLLGLPYDHVIDGKPEVLDKIIK